MLFVISVTASATPKTGLGIVQILNPLCHAKLAILHYTYNSIQNPLVV